MKVEDVGAVGGGGRRGYRGLGIGARLCDTCGHGAAARLYCRADGAFLCVACNARAHAAGVWLCDVCEHAPAVVTCRADAAALCGACDADIHSANPLASRHERIPVAPYFGGALPDAAVADDRQEEADDDRRSNEAEAASWLLPEPDGSAQEQDTFFTDSEAYLGLDLDFARSMDDIKTIGVPVAPSKLDGSFFYSEQSMNHSTVSSSEVAVVPDALSVVAKGKEEREARLMRYREKRKNRRFNKTIRYASRKAYAETRPRVKGRFAKRIDGPFFSTSASALVASDADYGVVPSYGSCL